MPNCDFYASGDDHRDILQFVFGELNCDVYELGSQPGCPCAKFHSLEEICSAYGFSEWSQLNRTILLQLHPSDAKGSVSFKETILKYPSSPDKLKVYATEGWGLVQLYLEPARKGTLRPSHTSHNSETRAMNWASTSPHLGPPNAWNWPAVTSFSRRLSAFIRKRSVSKFGSRVVLPVAEHMRSEGLQFGPN